VALDADTISRSFAERGLRLTRRWRVRRRPRAAKLREMVSASRATCPPSV